MGTATLSQLDLPELERRLRQADPSVLLVRPRLLRRIIKQDRHLPGVGLQVPHRKSYVLGRDALVRIVGSEELGLAVGQELPETVVLLARPDAERLVAGPAGQILRKYWRLLFHAAVHRALERKEAVLSEVDLWRRLRQLGPARVEEIRRVLRQEQFLLPPEDDREVYCEFAALYLELRHFAPGLLACYFPSIGSTDEIDGLLARDVDVQALLTHCRPEGAALPDPTDLVEAPETTEEGEPVAAPCSLADEAPPSDAVREKLLARASRAAATGNTVRAAIFRRRAGTTDVGSPCPWVADLDQFAERLQAALGLNEGDTAEWRQALEPLLGPASRGIWPVEARLLYDLQKACIDDEKDVYALDLVEWVVSLGKKPIKRKLPYQGLVWQIKHLRSAARRVRLARVTEPQRHRLADLLQKAQHEAEERLRTSLRPTLECELDEIGMRPSNLPERIARRKIVEELLDRVVARRYLTMGDLRDAVSRNNLKFPDLAGPGEFVRGDRLIQANRRLAVALDGIYHRGEIYLRWLQRFSSLAFGTPVGRFLTLYFALPFGGAYVILEGLQHLLSLATRLAFGSAVHLIPHAPRGEVLAPDQQAQLGIEVGVFGVFLLLLLHVRPFRVHIVQGLRLAGHGLRWLFVDLPIHIRNLPIVRRVLESRAFVLFAHYLLRPLLCGGLAGFVAGVLGDDWLTSSLIAFGTLSGTFILFNSRLVRDMEEAFVDWSVSCWRHVHLDLLPGLFRWVLAIFRRLLDSVNRGLYTVDEWLRFRTGDRPIWLVIKPLLGLVWFLVTYVVRFSINLLLEPQINPIKHFPVVTVSHKLVVVLIVPPLASALESALGLPREEAVGAAGLIGLCIPGIFGFLAWELRENWKLYRANRPATLRPVGIGLHGETMIRFLRPGFHSGTVPKLYLRLRRAARRRNWSTFAKHREALRHVEEALRHLIEREVIVLLEETPVWGGKALSVGAIRLGANRVVIDLNCPELGPQAVSIAFEEQAGWLLAGVVALGWASTLAKEKRRALEYALMGLYKLTGVNLIHEHVETCFHPTAPLFGVTRAGLVVGLWTPPPPPTVYDLEERPLLHPRRPDGTAAEGKPTLEASRLLFSEKSILWAKWVAFWEEASKGERCGLAEMSDVRLVPLHPSSPGR